VDQDSAGGQVKRLISSGAPAAPRRRPSRNYYREYLFWIHWQAQTSRFV